MKQDPRTSPGRGPPRSRGRTRCILAPVPPPDAPSAPAGSRSSNRRTFRPTPPAAPASPPAGSSGRAPSVCRAALCRPTPSVSPPAAPAAACSCRQAAEPGSWASAPSGGPAGRRRSCRRCPPHPCCASLAPTPSSGSHARPHLPSTVPRPPGVRDWLPPRLLRLLRRRRARLHPLLRRPSSVRSDSSAAWLTRDRPLYWPLPPFGPSAARRRLLCPRLTSAPWSGRLTATSVPNPGHGADLPR